MALKVQQKRQGSSFRDTLFKVFLLESSEPFPAFEHVVAAHRSQAMQGGGYQGGPGSEHPSIEPCVLCRLCVTENTCGDMEELQLQLLTSGGGGAEGERRAEQTLILGCASLQAVDERT